ncbi:MAG: hypothetical protein ACE5FP_00825 [Gemmatimonadota bacterium]
MTARFRLVRTLLDDRPLLVELFAAANLAFLVLDVFIAHSANRFDHPAEWIPLGFAGVGALALGVNLAAARPFRGSRQFHRGSGRRIGLVVGWGSIAIGVGGLAFHLESQFFAVLTLRSLVYSAPFVAPLAFTGVGFLLLLGRMVPHDSLAWSRWVLFLAFGGFVGNFLLSLIDHAQNGFFFLPEWIPVAAAALAVGALGTVLIVRTTDSFLRLVLWLLGFEVLVAVAGFVLHLAPLRSLSSSPLADRLVFGPPVFAPLLFADLALLAALGLAELRARHGS